MELPMIESGPRTCGLGILEVRKGEKRATLPLAGVAISARVAGRVAQVTVRETFRNPLTEPLEAVYVFPLPGGAAVSEFEMKVADRVIRGKVEERAEARRRYDRALEQGKRAALLEQERDDVFTVQVGNLPPGETAEVRITLSQELAFFEDGWTELRLPLVVAPRYIPGAPLDRDPVGDGVEWDTDVVPDASRITPPRLAPGFDPQVALGIDVELDGAEELSCSQHAVRSSATKVSLSRKDELLDRDFVLRWRVAKDRIATTVLVANGYGMLSILPPKRDGFLGVARDVVFVLDRSGSMGGAKMASAARACSILLATLGPRDRFAIQAFDDQVEWFDEGRFVAADPAGIERGDKYLRTIDARGGTEMDGAIGEALRAFRGPSSGRAPILVLLTDGQVGDESRILKRIQSELGDARVFTVGVDTAVNEGFLKRLASLAGGTATFVVPGEELEEALRAVGREIGVPLVTDLQVEGVESLTPPRFPDLFAGRAATAYFVPKGTVRVRGRFADGKRFEAAVETKEADTGAVRHLWARSRVRDLEDRFRMSSDDAIRREIVSIGVEHQILTRFTSFVLVDESEVVNEKGERRKIVQPVHVPAQWGKEEKAKSLPAGVAGGVSYCLAPPPPPCPAPQKSMEAMDEACFEEPPAPKVSPKERKAVEKAVDALARAIADAWAELSRGRVPKPDAIEKARAELRKLLESSELGLRLAALQKFLRTSAMTLVAALRAGGPAADLEELFARHAKELDEARKELDERYWEKTI